VGLQIIRVLSLK